MHQDLSHRLAELEASSVIDEVVEAAAALGFKAQLARERIKVREGFRQGMRFVLGLG